MSRTFALIPAAGHSNRMGQPKLLLPLAGQPLVLQVVAAWKKSRVDHIIIVVRPGDDALTDVVRASGVDLVVPAVPPPDMKASLQAALKHIEQQYAPAAAEAFLVAPADMPRLAPAVIDMLIRRHSQHPDQILVPTLAGRRGHPTLFPWTLAASVHALAAEEGLNTLVHRQQPGFVPCDELADVHQDAFGDIDTPDQYRQAADEYQR